MTISTVDTSSGPYVGNGIADTFEYDFKIFDKTQLTVLQTDTDGATTTLAVDSDYTVTNVGEDDGGDIVLSAPLVDDYQLFIRANIPVTQETDFESQGGFFPDVHEDAFDKLTLLIQQNAASLARSVRLSEDLPLDGDFVIAEDVDGRRNKVLRFDNNGDVELVEFGSIEGLQNFKIETVAVTAGVTEVTVPFTYLPNTNTIWVNVNGAYVPRSAYSELPGKIVFDNALAVGEVTFFGVSTAPVGTADAANVSYRETSTVEEQLDGALQTVDTLAELKSITSVDIDDTRYVKGLGHFRGDGSGGWTPVEKFNTPSMDGAVGDDSTDNQSEIVLWLAGDGYKTIDYGTYSIEGNTVTIGEDVDGWGGSLKHVGDEAGGNFTSFILNGGKLTHVNIEGTGRSSLIDMRGSRDAVHNSRIKNTATNATSGRGVFMNSTADYQSVIGSFLEAEKFALLSQENHTGLGLLVVGNYGISPDGAPFQYNHPYKTLRGLIHCGNYHGLSAASSGNPELGVGVAGTQGGVLGMSYIISSGDDAIHSEDGHRNIVFSGFVADLCRRYGINSLSTGQEKEKGDSPVYNAISMRGNGTTSTIGVNASANVDNSQIDGTIITSVVAEEFLSYGAQLGDAVFLADNLALVGCATGIRATDECRQYGDVYTNAGTLASVKKRAVVGPIHSAEPPSTAIVNDEAGATDAKGALRGFDYEFDFVHGGTGAEVINIPKFNLTSGGLVHGQVFVIFGSNGGMRGVYSAIVAWDGATLTVESEVSNGVGFSAVTLVDNSGVLAMSITGGAASVDNRATMEFRGVYYAG